MSLAVDEADVEVPYEERTQAFLKRIIEAGRAADLTATGPG